MKKILILNTTFDKGGAAQVARNLFNYFKNDKSLSLCFAYGRGKSDLSENTFYFGNKLEFLIHLFLVRFLGLEGVGSYFSTKKLINFIEQEKFDLIHIHNLHGYYVNFFMLLEYLNKKNIKVIWTLHDEWLFTWLPAHSMSCIHCKTLIGKCSNNYSYPKNYWPLFSHLMLKKKRKILLFKNITFICPASWLFEEAKNEFKITRVILIANGVDSNFFIPVDNKDDLRKKYNLPTDKKIVLFSANNFKDKNKGGEYLLKLAKSLEDKPYILGVIGSAKLSEFNNLFGFGYVNNRNKLSEIYALGDLYCSLSAVETAPLSVLEAMSCALPIVGFDIKALKGLVSDKNGKLTNYGNDKELAINIDKILGDESLLKILGEGSRKIILDNFDKNTSYFLYEKIYKL